MKRFLWILFYFSLVAAVQFGLSHWRYNAGLEAGFILGQNQEDERLFATVEDMKENCGHKYLSITNAASTKTISVDINCEAKYWP